MADIGDERGDERRVDAVAAAGVADVVRPEDWERVREAARSADWSVFGLVSALQGRLAAWGDAGGRAKAVAYGTLAELGCPEPVDAVLADAVLRRDDPVSWLALCLPWMTTDEERRAAVAAALSDADPILIVEGAAIVEARSKGDMPSWLGTLRDGFPPPRRAEAEAVMAAAFGRVPDEVLQA